MYQEVDSLDHFISQANEYDGPFLWGILRSKVLSDVSLWDILVDKVLLRTQECKLNNIPLDKMRSFLIEAEELLEEIHQMLRVCCNFSSDDPGQTDQEDLLLGSKVSKLLGHITGRVRLKNPQEYPEQYFKLFVDCTDDTTVAKEEYIDQVREDNIKVEPEDMDENEERVKKRHPKEREEKRHLKKGANKNGQTWKCDRCSKVFHVRSSYLYHHKKATKCTETREIKEGPPWKCDRCSKEFHVKASYYNHKRFKKCTDIPQPPLWYKKLSSHRYYCSHPDCLPVDDIVTDKTPIYKCRNLFWKHLVKEHIQEKDLRFYCDKCPMRFAYNAMLKDHTQKAHTFRCFCKFCGKGFVYKREAYREHLRTHTGERPFMCNKCDFRTTRNSLLKSHKSARHGEHYKVKPQHVCDICGKCFALQSKLETHVHTHSDIKRFTCPVCGQKLKNDSCYRRHMVCVHGQKSTCPLCNKDFSTERGLKLHKSKEHDINDDLNLLQGKEDIEKNSS